MIGALSDYRPSAPAIELYGLLVRVMDKRGNIGLNAALELMSVHTEIACTGNLLELKKASWITYDEEACEYRVLIPLRGPVAA